MAEYTKQHFIPKLLLSKFAIGKTINLYDLIEKKYISNIPYSEQCQKSYLYGKNLVIEKALGKIEDKTSKVFDFILDNDILPDFVSAEYESLITFISMQLLRTPNSNKQLQSFLDSIFEKFYKPEMFNNGIPDEILDTISMKFTKPYNQLLKLASLNIPLFFDLKMALVKNDTRIEFITSDNPCLIINRLKENCDGSTGISKSGIEILLPISPQRLIVLIDPFAYEYKVTLELKEKDVIDINTIIASYADRLIYSQSMNEVDIIKYTDNATNSKNHLTPKIEISNSSGKTNIEMLKKAPKLSNTFTLFKIKPNAHKIPEIRTNLIIKTIHSNYCEKVKKGELKVTEWRKYFYEELEKYESD
ncbi:MAG: DUF4238 domain-containing protein [Bacteroidales bacterium]|nr:DUF4238 domain-containing protein [Bacteroidales bacterium]